MGFRFTCARAISAVSTWGLKNVFRRPAANFPGKIALYVDPALIRDLSSKLKKGSVCVVGTNGKTTVTNLLADALEGAGERVVCNRTGANLDSGVATALLHADSSDWGVFESDELWLARILPYLESDYVLLLNLFRDQLDRVGEIDRIQDSIVGALESSPGTVLVYNVDDPLCAAIADRAGNRKIGFGIAEDMDLSQNTVADAQMCQNCSAMLEYDYRQYGQLGDYHCLSCGFGRPSPDYAAERVHLDEDGLSFELARPGEGAQVGRRSLGAPFSGAYMVYNLTAVEVAADLLGCPNEAVQRAVDAFDPRNGRLQSYEIGGRTALLNLAKNPTGFNQNIKIILQGEGPKAVAFFVNDKEADGHDVSWLWDIDFEELAGVRDLTVFAGGIRRNDVQVRLKYAGLDAQLVDSASALFAQINELPVDTRAYVVANYTALPAIHADMDRLAKSESNVDGTSASNRRTVSHDAEVRPEGSGQSTETDDIPSTDEHPVVIAHLFPDLMNLYGDGGNVRILARRLRDRQIPVETRRVEYGDSIDLREVDLVFLGGGPDREQRLALTELMRMRDDLRAFVEDDGALLTICGGYQILGRTWLLADEEVEGLEIIDMTTGRASSSTDRLIDNIVLRSPIASMPVVGYENHAGRTYLGSGIEPFGEVVSSTGHGNNESDHCDGVRWRKVVGTYLHGPLLAKNPEVADTLLDYALEHRERRTGEGHPGLSSLDDTAERAANDILCRRLGVQ